MNYSRANPSPRYVELQELYREMHRDGERFFGISGEKTYPGTSLLPQAVHIKRLVERTKARTILDYGSGKGQQYQQQVQHKSGDLWPSVMDYWDIDEIVCYDPCYLPFSTLPSGKFDGVISTDVLEHCPEEDMPWIVNEIFGYASRFVFANIAAYPAQKRLPTGENAHCTIKPVAWWQELIEVIAAKHPEVIWEIRIQSSIDTAERDQYSAQKIGNT